MNLDGLTELWSRFLSDEHLSREDELSLMEALRADPALREEFLKEAEVDGLVRGLSVSSGEWDADVRSVMEFLAAERDATRFIREVNELKRGGTARPDERVPPRRTTRRSLRRGTEGPGGLPWIVGLAAAGIFAAGLAFMTFSSPGPTRPGEGEAARSRAAKEALARGQAAREATKRAEEDRARAQKERERAEKDLAAAQEEQRRLAEARKQTEDVQKQAELRAREKELEQAVEAFKAKVAAPQKEEATAKAETPPESPRGPAPAKEGTKAAVARVEQARNAFHKGETKGPLKEGTDILANQGIEVGAAGMAILRYADQTRLEIGAETEVGELRTEEGKRVHVARGTVRAEVSKQPAGQAMIFGTPHGEATVVGTTLRIVVDPDPKKGTRLEVEEGKVRLKNRAGKTVDVPSGHYAVAAVGIGAEMIARVNYPDTPAGALLDRHGAVTLNFGPEGLKLPERVLNDSGLKFDPKRGHGWERDAGQGDGNTGLRPGNPSDPLLASYIGGGGANHTFTWKMTVANGRYLVTVCVGGVGGGVTDQGPHHVSIEGKQVVDAVLTAGGEFLIKKDFPVQVTDGELTMILGGHRSKVVTSDGGSDTVLNYIVVKRVP